MITYLLFITLAFGLILMIYGKASLNFDSIMKVFRQDLVFTGATAVSVEMDLDIPRGFIVKIHDAELRIVSIVEDVETISVDKQALLSCCLVKDPDDTTSIAVPSGVVDHDVLLDLQTDLLVVAGTAGDTSFYIGPPVKEANFSSEGLDVFTARNMRLNVDAFGTDAGDITEATAKATLHYTLEKITDDLIINLLDIL